MQPAVKEPALQRLGAEVTRLRRENDALLRELETAYAQLTAVLQVSQDETRIAYSELQEKLVVQEKKLVELGYLSRNASLKPGQQVVTSGDGGIFPPGIPVGRVIDVQSVDYGSRTEARVRLVAKLNALEEVWVMFP